MGDIREQHGRIAIEERRESFIVHAGYGYGVGRRLVGDLRLGDRFVADGRGWRLSALSEERAEARCEQTSAIRAFALDRGVDIPGTEEFDEAVPLAKRWRDVPHPEFALEDLDDLIAALTALRDERA